MENVLAADAMARSLPQTAAAVKPRTVAVLQPGYMPWLGFFDQMRRADVFVYYDDVPFDKHGWRNRNRIKGPAGPQWLTVPVLHKGRSGQLIKDVAIAGDPRWARTHLRTLRQCYGAAAHFDAYFPALEALLNRPWRWLVDLDMEVACLLAAWLEISPVICRSSELAVGGGRSERLVGLCRHFSATRYLSGDAAEDYLETPLFRAAGIDVLWQRYAHPVYKQLHGDFIPRLSAIDLILNEGPRSGAIHRMA